MYGFTDLDGSRPDAWRYMVEVQDAGKPADVTGYRDADTRSRREARLGTDRTRHRRLVRASGATFARALGRRGLALVLVARDKARLEALAAELAGAGARAEVLAADLADPAECARVEERLRSGVDLFVNNAALGASGRFVTWSVEAASSRSA